MQLLLLFFYSKGYRACIQWFPTKTPNRKGAPKKITWTNDNYLIERSFFEPTIIIVLLWKREKKSTTGGCRYIYIYFYSGLGVRSGTVLLVISWIVSFQTNVPHRIHVWYICVHLVEIFMVNVGKYTNPMDPMGTFCTQICHGFFPVAPRQTLQGRLWRINGLNVLKWRCCWQQLGWRIW